VAEETFSAGMSEVVTLCSRRIVLRTFGQAPSTLEKRSLIMVSHSREIWGLSPLPRLLRRRVLPLQRHSDQAEVDALLRRLARRLAVSRKEGGGG
jgi:hypothetical protein